MNAIVVHEFGDPQVLKLQQAPEPVVGPDSVLVRVRAVGVNPVETYIRAGTYAIKPDLPYTPGTDAAGEIEAVGADVKDRQVGQRVYLSGSAGGTYAEKAACDLKHVHTLPDRLTFAQGAAINVPYVTAYRALVQRAQARAGETVLVHGATGGVGLAAVQLAVGRGLRVIGTGGSEPGRRLVLEQGAAHALDHSQADYLDELMRVTDGNGPNVILEMRADLNLQKDLTVLAKFGRIAVIGNRGTIQIDPRLLMRNQGTIIGIMRGDEQEVAEAHRAIQAGLADGSINPVVGSQLPLAEAARAHQAVITDKAHGKIVLEP